MSPKHSDNPKNQYISTLTNNITQLDDAIGGASGPAESSLQKNQCPEINRQSDQQCNRP